MTDLRLRYGKVSIVDVDDFEYLNQWAGKWYFKGRYVGREQWLPSEKRNKWVLMHRELNKTPEGMETDHINGNTLDNRKSNLRTVTRKQNMANVRSTPGVSGLRGVWWHKGTEKWRAAIRVDGRRKSLGLFKDKNDAAIAWRQAAKKYRGEFARLTCG